MLGIDITDSKLEIPIRSVVLNFETAAEAAGPTAYILENALLRRALFEAVAPLEDITLFAPESVSGLDLAEPAARVRLASGKTLAANLIVAADGQRSALREMAGFKLVEWRSDQAAIVGTIAIRSRITAAPCSISCHPAPSPSCRW